jgi:hypothetical protein
MDSDLDRAIRESLATIDRSNDAEEIALQIAVQESLRSFKKFESKEIPIDKLAASYDNHMIWENACKLIARYKKVVTVLGDGNCLYRCLAIRLVELCRVDEMLHQLVVVCFMDVGDFCGSFLKFLLEPYDKLTDELILDGVRGLRELGARKCSQVLGADSVSIRKMGAEAEQPEIIAVLAGLPGGITVNVAILDTTSNGAIITIKAPNKPIETSVSIDLLHRPGHYDLLY